MLELHTKYTHSRQQTMYKKNKGQKDCNK